MKKRLWVMCLAGLSGVIYGISGILHDGVFYNVIAAWGIVFLSAIFIIASIIQLAGRPSRLAEYLKEHF